MDNSKKLILGLALCLVSMSSLSLGCEEAGCSVTDKVSTCPDRLCKGCYVEVFESSTDSQCNDCCPETNETTCTDNGCAWEYSGIKGGDECRNESGVECSGIPEVPTQSKTWLIVAFSVAGLGLALALRFKKRQTA